MPTFTAIPPTLLWSQSQSSKTRKKYRDINIGEEYLTTYKIQKNEMKNYHN